MPKESEAYKTPELEQETATGLALKITMYVYA